ncbi:hypothetical protein GCM10017687_11850 [Streptomyces echinatus]
MYSWSINPPGTGPALVPYAAALDLPHSLVEWVTMLIVTREVDRRGKLPPCRSSALRSPVAFRNPARPAGVRVTPKKSGRVDEPRCRHFSPSTRAATPGGTPSAAATRSTREVNASPRTGQGTAGRRRTRDTATSRRPDTRGSGGTTRP